MEGTSKAVVQPCDAPRARYKHEPLASSTSIRLLRLSMDTSGWSDHISGEMHHFELANAPEFVALSYVWGDPAVTRTIHIRDENGDNRAFGIHESLWELLYSLTWLQERQSLQGSYLWTDCICLDQSNADEINQQIPRMGEVYSSAQRVIAWLGDDEATGRDVEQFSRGLSQWRRGSETMDMSASPLEEIPDPLYAAQHVFSLPYWERTWIAQEVVLAKEVTVMGGKAHLDLDILIHDVATILHAQRWRMQENADAMDALRAAELDDEALRITAGWTLCLIRSRTSKRIHFEDLIRNHISRTSSRTIDRVYGLLGLVEPHTDGGNPALLIEANMQKTPCEVFWDVLFECRAAVCTIVEMRGHLADALLCEPGSNAEDIHWERFLARYMLAPRTSERHLLYAGYVMQTYRILLLCRLATDGGLEPYISSLADGLRRRLPAITRLQESVLVAISLPLQHADLNEPHVISWMKSCRWRCKRHHCTFLEEEQWKSPRAVCVAKPVHRGKRNIVAGPVMCKQATADLPCNIFVIRWDLAGVGLRIELWHSLRSRSHTALNLYLREMAE